jgi:SAM-dependent methyltransferase
MKLKNTIDALIHSQLRPPPFERGEALFWDDPYISQRMLEAHLNPNTDAASRKPETIDQIVTWLVAQMSLSASDALLDLGCGPGLYASRFASCGLRVTGVDYSIRSINYATEQARTAGQSITYRYQNYLSLQETNQYDAVCLIYGDYCPLNPGERQQLLHNVRRALKPGGTFALDVTTPTLRRLHGLKNSWYAAESGFWKPGPHLVLEQGFSYPDDLYLDQYVVLEADGTLSVYRNWFQDFTAETIQAELLAGGFEMVGLWSDLKGTPLHADSEWIGVIVKKQGEGHATG